VWHAVGQQHEHAFGRGEGPVVELDLERAFEHVDAFVRDVVRVPGDIACEGHLEQGEPAFGVGGGGFHRERGR
jgi:hypothetical protein